MNNNEHWSFLRKNKKDRGNVLIDFMQNITNVHMDNLYNFQCNSLHNFLIEKLFRYEIPQEVVIIRYHSFTSPFHVLCEIENTYTKQTVCIFFENK